MKSGRRLIGCVAALTLLGAAACSSSSSSGSGSTASGASSTSGGQTSGQILVASPSDETGPDSVCGLQWKEGLTAATLNINSTGGILGKKLVVDYQDVQSNPALAAQTTQNMIQSGKYVAVIPTACGAESGPILDATNRAKMLFVGTGAVGTLGNGSDYPYAFNTNFNPAPTSVADACAAIDMKPTSVGMLALNDSYSQATANGILAKFKSEGVKVVANEQLSFTAVNATTQLQAIQAKNPEMLYIVAYGVPMHAILSSLKTLNYQPKMILGSDSVSATPLQPFADGPLPPNFYAVTYPPAARAASGYTAAQQTLITNLDKVGGTSGGLQALALEYDAALLLRWAVDKTHSVNSQPLQAALETLSTDTSANPGTVGMPRPPYNSTQHAYAPTSDFYPYYVVNMTPKPQNGTYPIVKQIGPC